ncbi:DUF1240 domain-containing protein [Providencia hangzhouensis]|uniref:Protein of uncharacterized function (DUF1240) n=3 Tax=Providencia TaxID=586 RepID=A0A2A5Q4P8_PRORE|nr:MULTISPECIES: DUF1240 domain-containing protein [Providencia]MBN6366797.1 DUF1240 domain-containing protein [Providencia rettgeri]MBQ0266488.1 DUF1240 domain-containing protein [Providencia rettgeri]MBQ0372617.1 DUF1240 domain-containing protein [Providencia rettgeri]MBQ0531043.1 DUF1240 domain-containing protein [Providencia rettgeri]MBT0662479.1 DUF1240 domain-containing protein [Providencia rettgeri]
MVKINPFKLYLIAAFLLFLALFCFYNSIIYYKNYFMMKDRILFSFQTGLLCFAAPFIIYFSYLSFTCGYTKKPQKMNNKLASLFAGIGVVGIIFSFFFSAYVSIDLASKGYYTCYKPSIFAPNEYVISKEMCK